MHAPGECFSRQAVERRCTAIDATRNLAAARWLIARRIVLPREFAGFHERPVFGPVILELPLSDQSADRFWVIANATSGDRRRKQFDAGIGLELFDIAENLARDGLAVDERAESAKFVKAMLPAVAELGGRH